MWNPPEGHPLRRMFAGLAEHAFFSRLGVADPPLIDYLSSLLTRFVHNDTIYQLRDTNGHRMTQLVDMLQEAEQLPVGGRARRDYFRHVGDFALFWTGLYPETLDRLRSPLCKDHLVSYTTQGKRGYWITSQLDEENHRGEAALFRRLSEQFEMCAIGLREVRREWEELALDRPPGGTLIQ